MSRARRDSTPLSRRASASQGTGCLVGFFSVFLLVGLGFLVAFLKLGELETGESWALLVPALFVAVGGGGIAFALAAARRARRPPTPKPLAWTAEGGEGRPLVLRPARGPVGRLVGTILAALVWNGIVGLFVVAAVGESDAGCMYFFLAPFVFVGLLLLAAVPYQLLTLANPRPVLTFPAGTPRPGEEVELAWTFSGPAGRLRRLTIAIEGFEEVHWREGKSTRRERSVFARLAAVDLGSGSALAAGAVRVPFPTQAVPTFRSDHARVGWVVKLRGVIPNWPDVSEEIPLPVAPALPRGESA